jgi:hypothetical protein
MLQVWSRQAAARVIDQLFVEEGVDAWWIEFEDLIQESNNFRLSRVDITSYGIDLA